MPNNEGTNETKRAIELIENTDKNDPVADSKSDRVLVDEMYFSDGMLNLSVLMGDWFVSLAIPFKPDSSLRNVLSDVSESFDIATRESGYYLTNSDVEFVETFTPDDQGRVTVGRQYANTPIKLIGSISDNE